MTERAKILVAYDGSENAEAALEDLKREGWGPEAEILVMTVADVFLPPPINEELDDTFPMYVPEGVKLALARGTQKLAEADSLARQGSDRIKAAFPAWTVRHEAQADSPAWALIRVADEWKPDLILMGARGHSVLGGRLILGSVSQRVLYEARSSVRIARAQERTKDGPVRILIGVDHSPDSDAAVAAVCRRRWPKGSEVALLSVVDTVMAINPDHSDSSVTRWIEVSDQRSWQQVREIFAPAAQKLRDAGLHAEVLIRRGNPADEILKEADTWGADCIFVGAKGTRGIDRLLLGSVSSAVSARAHCSVEVVRPL
ncbi:MAG TPA: universal stress protein [Pyrinomonadaceae bacterium]|jgi:nucleotide-binding universal stress UspA family protein|nr:universal stress protein [Pyrinomonadaceae bacterium]